MRPNSQSRSISTVPRATTEYKPLELVYEANPPPVFTNAPGLDFEHSSLDRVEHCATTRLKITLRYSRIAADYRCRLWARRKPKIRDPERAPSVTASSGAAFSVAQQVSRLSFRHPPPPSLPLPKTSPASGTDKRRRTRRSPPVSRSSEPLGPASSGHEWTDATRMDTPIGALRRKGWPPGDSADRPSLPGDEGHGVVKQACQVAVTAAALSREKRKQTTGSITTPRNSRQSALAFLSDDGDEQKQGAARVTRKRVAEFNDPCVLLHAVVISPRKQQQPSSAAARRGPHGSSSRRHRLDNRIRQGCRTSSTRHETLSWQKEPGDNASLRLQPLRRRCQPSGAGSGRFTDAPVYRCPAWQHGGPPSR
ncbi:hypothetical protein HPB51_008621 [Rhipicephalus microplus]|uniref:Uncharacterized protein n=1 Tax=Rhipicephalus microplus TaxID=6941 RepID=A0A9J6EN22_RHIMP|nr:hypothetical protein HPB51_008621 [Rhipicephalus microplus]